MVTNEARVTQNMFYNEHKYYIIRFNFTNKM